MQWSTQSFAFGTCSKEVNIPLSTLDKTCRNEWFKSLALIKLIFPWQWTKILSELLAESLMPLHAGIEGSESLWHVERLSSRKQPTQMCCQALQVLHLCREHQDLFSSGSFPWQRRFSPFWRHWCYFQVPKCAYKMQIFLWWQQCAHKRWKLGAGFTEGHLYFCPVACRMQIKQLPISLRVALK